MKLNIVLKMLSAAALSLFVAFNAQAQSLQIVAAGGYKKPMMKVIEAYTAQTGKSVEASFGNMRQIITQAQAADNVALVIGDERFLKSEAFLSGFEMIGKGKLVLAWATSTLALSTPADLIRDDITRIAHSDYKKAIYGKATSEWLSQQSFHTALQDKLMQVATIPQVSSYLVAREVDAGFINLTDAIGLGDKIGGYLLLEQGYSEINIVAGLVKQSSSHTQNNTEAKAFLAFMQSPAAQSIFKQFGM